MSQLVDDVLNSALEVEIKVSEAAEGFERAINMASGSKDSASNDPVANRKTVGAVNKEMAGTSANNISRVLVAVAPKGNMYTKVGVYYAVPLMANHS